ncbi:MAG TPA: roadblock/LC7 domain-containing protein [Methanothermobacter sp.]|nr:roadblock/LC7 domain-containing protein [Methanothermobacter sp.]
MAKVINKSSQKLLKMTKQGQCKTIILELQESKILLLNIENLQLLILADEKAKLGHIILVSEKNRKKLQGITPGKEVKEEISKVPDKAKIREAVKTKKVEGLPEIKPPISLPSLEKKVKVPADENGRIELALKIYEHLLLAMSIGASKIMGVAPARGMLKKSLPDTPILKNVEVKANATIEFNTIKSNIKKSQYGLEDIIKALNEIIWSITENYGRVMGYDAFKGMIRPEFKSLHEAYGLAIKKLGIEDGIHPELKKLWE